MSIRKITDFEKEKIDLLEEKITLETGEVISSEVRKRKLELLFDVKGIKTKLSLSYKDAQALDKLVDDYLNIFG